MNLSTKVFISFILVFCTGLAFSQPSEEVNQTVEFVLRDGAVRTAQVDARQLLSKNTIVFNESKQEVWAIQDVDSFTMDSIRYFVRRIEAQDTFKVTEKIINGKISLYRSPRLSTRDEIFAEKQEKFYELRIIRKDIGNGTYKVKEYASYLMGLMRDCDAINQRKIEADLQLSLPAIIKIVTSYNTSCGWQEKLEASKEIKPRLRLGVIAGAMLINHRLKYRTLYEGKSSLNGIFAGPSLGLDFRKFYDSRINFDILVEQLNGEGNADPNPSNPGPPDHLHHFNMLFLRNVLTFNLSLFKSEHLSVYGGLGSAFIFQIKNTTVSETSRNQKLNFKAENDKFNLAPAGHIHADYHRVGFRYQVVPLSIQMRALELFGIEHRVSLHYTFNN